MDLSFQDIVMASLGILIGNLVADFLIVPIIDKHYERKNEKNKR